MKRFSICILVVAAMFLGISPAKSNVSLKVVNPQGMSQWTSASIDTLQISVTPQGLYAELGIYMTISPTQYYAFKPKDSLEVEYKFNLSANAMIVDSWLWFDEYIIKAKHYDRWTGSAIYENIVRRFRRDPSIIYKNSATQYEMRIYPIQPESYRKVKMTVLVPININSQKASVVLPFGLASVSKNKNTFTDVIFFENEEFKNPSFDQNATSSYFTDVEDNFFGKYKHLHLGSGENANATLYFDSPMKDGIYLHANRITGKYQFAFDKSINKEREPKNIMFVYNHHHHDFAAKYQLQSHNQIIGYIRHFMLNSLNARDSINLSFPQFNYTPISNAWLPCTPENVDLILSSIDTTKIFLHNYLAPTMINSISWVEKQNRKANIFLISSNYYSFSAVNNNNIEDYVNESNALITEILKENKSANPIHILESFEKLTYIGRVNGINFYNNQYIFNNLSRFFNGKYVEASNKGTEAAFKELADDVLYGQNFKDDLQVSVENGFTYSNYSIDLGSPNIVSRIGSFVGDNSFNLRLITLEGKKITTFEKSIPLSTEAPIFYKTNQILAGLQIADDEKISNPSNQLIHQIINTALDNRVLSKYTVFLALEHGDTLHTAINSDDFGEDHEHTGIDDDNSNSSLSAAPNPFTDLTTIKFELDQIDMGKAIEIFVSDVLGNKVKTLLTSSSPKSSAMNIAWDGTSEAGSKVQAGVYFITLKIGTRQITIKVLKI